MVVPIMVLLFFRLFWGNVGVKTPPKYHFQNIFHHKRKYHIGVNMVILHIGIQKFIVHIIFILFEST